MSKASELGRLGEDLAATYLMRNGFRILHRNWNRYNGYELDIVAYKGGTLHFVEVKTRSSDTYSSPFDAINNDKMVHIYSAIQHYFRFFRLPDSYPWVFDAVAVVCENEGKHKIEFREDVGGDVDYAAYYRKKYCKPPLTW
jgi:putative endonuclease